MAFGKATSKAAGEASAVATQQVNGIRSWHADRVADLLKAAEGSVDANTALAAVATWRSRQEECHQRWRKEALLLITAGDDPDTVCAGLRFGRTALEKAARVDPRFDAFTHYLYRAHPKQKEAS
ncbi:hypothetical protein [Mycobacteroides abscessus]|uniref:hypothetical protein n=1 Tax=Mycobacteroides abscessus TaxID=36809 RepID=UPI0014766961